MTYSPDFYSAFSCRADACSHSCCRGWEIDVDEDTCALYDSVPEPFGDRLRDAVIRDDDGAHFALTEDDRCPFLRLDGLCEIICRLGEDALCDICALHPRFFETVGEHELCGLGLSCEAVCSLLLSSDKPLTFFCEETGERLTMQQLLTAFGIHVSDRDLCYDGRRCSTSYLDRMAKTEPIDAVWTAAFSDLRENISHLDCNLPTGVRYDRILQYILYRQMERLKSVSLRDLLRFAQDSTAWVASQEALSGPNEEYLRRWSEQIEYSTENVEVLLHG